MALVSGAPDGAVPASSAAQQPTTQQISGGALEGEGGKVAAAAGGKGGEQLGLSKEVEAALTLMEVGPKGWA